jgi:hypothetical protein
LFRPIFVQVPTPNIVVVVRPSLEPGQTGLVDDAGGVVDAQPVEEGAAVGGDREPEAVGAEQADQRLGHEAGLQGQQHMRGALSQLPMASGPWIWRPTDAAQRPAQMNFLEGLQP